jgi:hypothetical protein
MFGKKGENDLGIDSDDEDNSSVATEAGVDDSGAMSKFHNWDEGRLCAHQIQQIFSQY